MKYFYLTGSVVLSVVILVLGFGNIGAGCNNLYFFYRSVDNQVPVTFLLFSVAILGIVTGIFYGAYIRAIVADSRAEDDGEGGL